MAILGIRDLSLRALGAGDGSLSVSLYTAKPFVLR